MGLPEEFHRRSAPWPALEAKSKIAILLSNKKNVFGLNVILPIDSKQMEQLDDLERLDEDRRIAILGIYGEANEKLA